MNQSTGRELLIAILRQHKTPVPLLIFICALFKLCCPNPQQVINTDELKNALHQVADDFGVRLDNLTLEIIPIRQKQNPNLN